MSITAFVDRTHLNVTVKVASKTLSGEYCIPYSHYYQNYDPSRGGILLPDTYVACEKLFAKKILGLEKSIPLLGKYYAIETPPSITHTLGLRPKTSILFSPLIIVIPSSSDDMGILNYFTGQSEPIETLKIVKRVNPKGVEGAVDSTTIEFSKLNIIGIQPNFDGLHQEETLIVMQYQKYKHGVKCFDDKGTAQGSDAAEVNAWAQ